MPTFWEWKDDNDLWTPYDFRDNKLIEEAHKTGVLTFVTTALTFNAGYDSRYSYDFKKMTQSNLDSGRVRQLRRIEAGGDEKEEAEFCAGLGVAVGIGAAPPATAMAPLAASVVAAAAADDEPPPKKAKAELPATTGPTTVVVAVTPSHPPAAPTVAPTVTPTVASIVASTALAAHAPPDVDAATIAAQTALGAQSKRRQKYDLGPVGKDPHGKHCFDQMLWRENQLCGEWAVFYHSYSLAAVLYEVQAAVAAVLFRFKSEYATLPRLLKEPYGDLPDAEHLLKLFPKLKVRDHDPRYRAVAICGTSSILAYDSEAPPLRCFLCGYSCADLSFFGVLENLLGSCGVPTHCKKPLAHQIVDLCAKHGLDASQFGGKPCKSGRAGHLLQIFMKRTLVKTYVYGAFPFGVPDKKRLDLEAYLEGPGPIEGQVRIVCNPSVFMRGNAVRMYVYSADPSFHANRPLFQKELTALLDPIIGCPSVRTAAAKGIYGGSLPSWFVADDYEKHKAATGS